MRLPNSPRGDKPSDRTENYEWLKERKLPLIVEFLAVGDN